MPDAYRLTLPQRLVRRSLAMPSPWMERFAGPSPSIDGRTLAPAVNMILALSRRGVAGTGTGDDVERRRRDIRRSTRLILPSVRSVHVGQATIPRAGGGIPVRVYRSHHLTGPAPVIVYYHGGGWVVGDLETHDGSCRMIAEHAQCVVVSVDYRLAPEHPFPAGLDDALAAFAHVRDHAREFGGIPGAVAVMGDSAGANLAAVVCLLTREQGPAPIAQSLVYPAVDLTMSSPSIETFAEGFMLTREDLQWYRDQYLPDPHLVTDPRVSPLLADDLGGLPPARIWTAGFDVLRDEGEEYARRLQQAGVDARSTCVDDQIHGFFGIGLVPGGMDVIEQVCRETGELVHASAAAT